MKRSHKGLSEQIRSLLAKATEPMTAAQIYAKCDLAENAAIVSKALWTMESKNQLNKAAADGGRYVWSLKDGVSITQATGRKPNVAPLPAEPAVPVTGDNVLAEAMASAIEPLTTALRGMRDQQADRNDAVEGYFAANHPQPKRRDFDLLPRLDAIATDIEDAMSDAVDSDQDKDIVKALIVACGAVNRASRRMREGAKA